VVSWARYVIGIFQTRSLAMWLSNVSHVDVTTEVAVLIILVQIPISDLLFKYLSYTHSISNNNVRRCSQHLCLPDAALSLGLALPGLAVDVLCGSGLESGLVLRQI